MLIVIVIIVGATWLVTWQMSIEMHMRAEVVISGLKIGVNVAERFRWRDQQAWQQCNR